MKGGGQEKVPEGRATRFEPPKILVGGILDVTEDLRGNSSNCSLYTVGDGGPSQVSEGWRPRGLGFRYEGHTGVCSG